MPLGLCGPNNEQVYVEPRTSAPNMTLPATAARASADVDRYLVPALPPVLWLRQSCCCDLARAAGMISTEQTDRQTDGRTDTRTPDRYIDPAPYATRAASVGRCRTFVLNVSLDIFLGSGQLEDQIDLHVCQLLAFTPDRDTKLCWRAFTPRVLPARRTLC